MPPVVLALETSGQRCSVALIVGERLVERRAEDGSAQAERVLAMVDAVCIDADLALDACDAVAYSAGPGAFTGLRIGCAVAQGLAFGAAALVVAVGSLDAIAEASIGRIAARGARLLVAQDARMGEVYWATFVRGVDRWMPEQPPTLDRVAALRENAAAHAAFGAGNAWTVHADALAGIVQSVVATDGPSARALAVLGRRASLEGLAVAPHDATLLYVRDRVASTIAERTSRRDAARVPIREAPR